MYVCMYVHMHVLCIYVYVYMYECMYVRTYVYVLKHVCTVQLSSILTLARVSLVETRLTFKFVCELVVIAQTCLVADDTC